MVSAARAVPAPMARAGGTSAPSRLDIQGSKNTKSSSLSAKEQSDGLQTWLADNGYKMPAGAGDVLGSYIKQKMHFFVAKVDLNRMKLADRHFIRPLQVRYESAKFMLLIRLGTVNADGPQDLVLIALTQMAGSRRQTIKHNACRRRRCATVHQGQVHRFLPRP